uniref:Uncharacterized protein n=1 Tax=Fagus sylvatica TaxID=28930 RepID=A0A2N9J2F1_FAGSY
MVFTSQIDDPRGTEPLLGPHFEIRPERERERERAWASHGGSVMEVVSGWEELLSCSHGDPHGSRCLRERGERMRLREREVEIEDISHGGPS